MEVSDMEAMDIAFFVVVALAGLGCIFVLGLVVYTLRTSSSSDGIGRVATGRIAIRNSQQVLRRRSLGLAVVACVQVPLVVVAWAVGWEVAGFVLLATGLLTAGLSYWLHRCPTCSCRISAVFRYCAHCGARLKV
jgi:hypothetical protein